MKTLLLLLLCTLSAQAQLTLRSAAYPPLFRGGSFTPASLTNLFVWYNASAATNVPGTGAEYLVDQSGNARNMNQSTNGRRPTFDTNQVNGLPAWTWDGSDDVVGGSFSAGSSFGMFILVKMSATTNSMRGFFDSAPDAVDTFRFFSFSTNELQRVELHDAQPAVQGPTNSLSEVFVYDVRAMVTGGRALDVTKNLGTPVTGTNVSTTSIAWSGPKMGSINKTFYYWGGQVVEVIITSPYGSGTDRTNIVNYLKGRAGL